MLLTWLPAPAGVPALVVADFDGRNEVVAGDWAGWAYLWRPANGP